MTSDPSPIKIEFSAAAELRFHELSRRGRYLVIDALSALRTKAANGGTRALSELSDRKFGALGIKRFEFAGVELLFKTDAGNGIRIIEIHHQCFPNGDGPSSGGTPVYTSISFGSCMETLVLVSNIYLEDPAEDELTLRPAATGFSKYRSNCLPWRVGLTRRHGVHSSSLDATDSNSIAGTQDFMETMTNYRMDTVMKTTEKTVAITLKVSFGKACGTGTPEETSGPIPSWLAAYRPHTARWFGSFLGDDMEFADGPTGIQRICGSTIIADAQRDASVFNEADDPEFSGVWLFSRVKTLPPHLLA